MEYGVLEGWKSKMEIINVSKKENYFKNNQKYIKWP